MIDELVFEVERCLLDSDFVYSVERVDGGVCFGGRVVVFEEVGSLFGGFFDGGEIVSTVVFSGVDCVWLCAVFVSGVLEVL